MKFLDAQRIHNLTKFLQALHEKKKADPDHTTLLLSCYTKLKDVNQLDKFIAADWEFSAEVRLLSQTHPKPGSCWLLWSCLPAMLSSVGAHLCSLTYRLPLWCAGRAATTGKRCRSHASTRSTTGC